MTLLSVVLLGALLLLSASVQRVSAQDATACPLQLNNAREQQALIDIYQATQGFTWRVNLQWPQAGENPPIYDPCCWVGVTCKIVSGAGVHVFELNLAHNNLRGTLPEAIGNLDYLTKLFLHSNQIGGALPNALASLTRLQLLFLSDNKFTGAVPNLGSLRQLQVLYLENNQLSGNFPAVSSLQSLEAIDVSGNAMMTGSLPSELPSKVKDFRANNCAFTGSVPDQLIRSSTLQSIQIKGNQLTGPVGSISTRSIKILDISSNRLGCFAPDLDLGIDLRLTDNKFLCLPGIARLPGCVNPVVSALTQVCTGASMATCTTNGAMSIDPNYPSALATLRLDDAEPLIGCDDVYCFLGSLASGKASLVQGRQNEVQCTIAPNAVGVYSISLRRSDGTLLSAVTSPVTLQVKAGCGQNNCNPPNGVCTPDGCVCDQQNWGGTECNEKLCPRNCLEASGHGKCNKATGVCECNTAENWGGADCSLKQIECPTGGPQNLECSGNGRCVYATGECRCFPQPVTIGGEVVTQRYSGAACNIVECPVVNDKVCSGHGTCLADGRSQPCQCSGATGYDCNTGTQTCPGCTHNELDEFGNAKASCDTFTGKCLCSARFQGTLCRERACPSDKPNSYSATGDLIPGTVCSGHGTCNTDTGECTCDAKYNLLANCAAEIKECPKAANGLECGGPTQGNCRPLTGQCVCADNIQRAYEGENCDTPKCPSQWEDCDPEPRIPGSPKGQCNAATGTCTCNEGWTGDFCLDQTCIKDSTGSECGEANGLGTCDRGSGICKCTESGGDKLDPKTACTTKLCAGSNHDYDCTGSGTCENGVCICDDGFEGEGCESASPPWGAIIGGIVGAVILVICCAVLAFFLLRRAAINRLQNS